MLLLVVMVFAGCNGIRYGPSNAEQQNAYLHHRTAEAAAIKARQDMTSPELQQLANRSSEQTQAFIAYYGLPKELPNTDTVDELLGDDNQEITQEAQLNASQRPDPWEVADGLLELGLGLAGIVGGVYGTKAAKVIVTARQKSKALREVVNGNELFKQDNPEMSDKFKEAQSAQSTSTRKEVAVLKA